MAAAIPIALTAAAGVAQVAGGISSANAQAGSLREEATQLDAMAVSERASAQREGVEQRRQARLLQSRALAVAAAQGGASDPTVVNILANLAGEGEFRALSAMFEGEERARSKEMQARVRRKEAKNIKKAGLITAVGQGLSTASTMYERYG